MAVYTEYRIKYTCDLESELNLSWGEGAIAFCKQNGGKWWKVESGAWVEKTVENPPSGGGGYDGDPNIITQNSTHRFVSDAEKSTWNGKQDALGFTPANESHNHDSTYEAKNANIQAHVSAPHAPIIYPQYTFIGQQAWTNKNVALQEFLNSNQRRLTIDMTNATQFRIISNVTVQGAAASVTGVQYSDDGGTTWRGLDNGTSGINSTVTVSDLGTGSKVSSWTNLAAGAKADRIVRIAGSGGDGALDPAFSNISIQLK